MRRLTGVAEADSVTHMLAVRFRQDGADAGTPGSEKREER